jgi:prophage endopeptidase
MLSLIPASYRLLAIAGACAGCFVIGWTIQGWRLGAKISDLKTDHSELLRRITTESNAALQAANDDVARKQATIRDLDLERIKRNQAHETEINNLRIAVGTGARRLRVRATCPNTQVPTATGGAAGTAAAAPELDPSARQDYYGLRERILQTESTLTACQDILAEMAGNGH